MRICVFCNKIPENKNNEHVIPEWLLELTGGLKRPLYLANGRIYFSPHNIGNLVFPACTICNDSYSKLEGKTKKIVLNMINEKPLDSKSFMILLDWLDKVRVGLSLGLIMKTNNKMRINPQYGISTREKTDRIIFIERYKYDKPSLTFTGYEDPLFYMLPSFFGIYFNGIFIISASNSGLLSNKNILPSIEKPEDLEGRKYFATLNYRPTQDKKIPHFGTKTLVIAEVNYSLPLNRKHLTKEQKELLRKDVRGSEILIEKDKKFIKYPHSKSSLWKKGKFDAKKDLQRRFTRNFMDIRKWVAKESYTPKKWKPIQDKLITMLQPYR